MKKYLSAPYIQFALIAALLASFVFERVSPSYGGKILLFVSALGSAGTALSAIRSVFRREIGIDTFNIFAVLVAFVSGDTRAAGFIVLMLAFASLLEWRVESRAGDSVKALLALKPRTAFRENPDLSLEEIDATLVRSGDILVVKTGNSVPVDGEVIEGKAEMNEASVTGEWKPVGKVAGDVVLGGTSCESGFLKIKATKVGEDSTLERMIRLMKEASK